VEEISLTDFASPDALDMPHLSRAERRDQQTQRIMEAAKTCFVRHGFQGASMQQICAEAGMSPGALYRYFPSKEAMVEAICEADRQQDTECFISLLENPSVVDGLVEAAVAHMRHVHESGNARLFAEIRAESMRNEAILATCNRCRGPVAELIHQQLSGAIARGEIAPAVDLGTLMAAIMAIGEGLALNDLPALGVTFDKLETVIRDMLVGMLRPTQTNTAPAA
jgi:AcrR family transcriptional regulator